MPIKLLLDDALVFAKNLQKNLRLNGKKVSSRIVGSCRQKKEKVGDIDILIITNRVLENYDLVILNHKYKWIRKGVHLYSGFCENVHVDIFFCLKENLACAMLHHTGPASYNIRLRKYAKDRGFHLNQYGLFYKNKKIKTKTERDVVKKLGTTYYPPEERE